MTPRRIQPVSWLRAAALTVALAVVGGMALGRPGPAAAQADDASAPVESSVSLAEAFFMQKNARTGELELFGSAIIWFLLALSAASVGLIVTLALENRRDRILPGGLLKETHRLVERGQVREAASRAGADPSFFGRTLHASLREHDAGHDAMLRALEQACDEHVAFRLRRVESLNIIGSVAPMIGLFGTVYGMILAFREIVAAGGSPDPVGLAAGIGTALTTTFWGLVVAIPALAGYALVRNTLDALTSEAALRAEDLVNRLRPAQAPPPPPENAEANAAAQGAA